MWFYRWMGSLKPNYNICNLSMWTHSYIVGKFPMGTLFTSGMEALFGPRPHDREAADPVFFPCCLPKLKWHRGAFTL